MLKSWFDGHLDTILNLTDSNYQFAKYNPGFHVDLPRMKNSGVKIAIFSIFVEPNFIPDRTMERTFELLEHFYRLLEKHSPLQHIKSYTDINRVLSKQSKIGIILGLEGGNSILNLSTLNVFYRMGVRLLSLTWNHNNHLAGGILPRNKDMGLSKMGKEVIELMNRLGIIIDVSHLGRRSFYDVLKVSTGPLVASHANAYQICSHPRNLTDHQITALAKRKGLIGVNFYPPFLNNSRNAKIIDVIRHIDYIRELVGEKYIGLGSDFDGIDCTPENLYDISTVPELFSTLSERNYSDRQIDMLGQDNWLRVCKSILGG